MKINLFAALLIALLSSACAPKNIQELSKRAGGTLIAHSKDSVSTVTQRVSKGIEECSKAQARVRFTTNKEPSDVSLEFNGGMYGVIANAHLVPVDDGTDATITYWKGMHKKFGLIMQKLVDGDPPNC